MSPTMRIGTICGLVPLTVGTAVFAGFLVTQDSWLALPGYFTMVGGLVLFAVGVVLAVVSARHRGDWKRFFAALGIMLVNFPAAAAMTYVSAAV
jgi:hypothetical protein